MNNPLTRLTLLVCLICLTIAPFAGLAPLMVLLLVTSVAWALEMIQQIIVGRPAKEQTQGLDRYINHP
ncbi:MAG: hypothetical protein WA902_23145 [Thermosynechococcaceae cyanobacterium]